MQKDKAIFLGIVGGVILLLIIYSFIAFGRRNSGKMNEKDFEAPNIVIEQTKSLYNSRIDALTRDKYEIPERENPLRYNFLDDSPEEEKTKNVKENKENKDTIKKSVKIITKQNKKVHEKQIKQESFENQRPIPKNKPDDKLQPEQTNIRYAFSTGENHIEINKSEPTGSIENNWAQLDEKVVIRDNSFQVFLLENNARISGKLFAANSKLFTKAIVKKDFIDILVHRIKDSNTGEEYNVDMYAINEDRSRGIKYQGRTNRETDKASKNVISETMQHVYRRYDVDEITEAAGEGLEEIAGRDRVEVPIGKGYRLIFIENTSQ